MLKECRNIYQIARESTGLTQEKASELMNISVDSLRAYEGCKRIPPDKVVIKMIEIYDTQYLAYQHLKTNAEVGQKYLPNIQFKTLSEAVLNLLDEYNAFVGIEKTMISISKDNQIDEDERLEWKQVENVLDHIVEAIMALKFAK